MSKNIYVTIEKDNSITVEDDGRGIPVGINEKAGKSASVRIVVSSVWLEEKFEEHIADEIRYFCMMRPIAPRKIEIKEQPLHDPLNQYVETGKYNRVIFRRP